MSIAAQLAQQTKLFIAGSPAAPVTITAVVPGYPTIITSAAHGLENGDYGPIADIVGTIGTDATNGLNGQSLSISNVTDDTFAVNVDTTGLAYTSGGTFTPTAWLQMKEMKTLTPAGATATKIDVTDLDSTAKEYKTGLADNGEFTAELNVLESDPGQVAILAAFLASTNNQYKVVTAAKTRTFNGSCLSFPTLPNSSVDNVQIGTANFQINGDITVS